MTSELYVRALGRGLRILTFLRENDSASLHEIHEATGLARPTILRLLATLETDGYVRRWMTDGRYRPNAAVHGHPAPPHLSELMADISAPYLEELVAKVSWPSDVAVYDNGRMVLGETTRRRTPHLINRVEAGYKVHVLQSAVGRAYLSFSSEPRRQAILKVLAVSRDKHDRRARNRDIVQGIISETLAAGYATRQSGYWASNSRLPLDLNAIAIPIMCDGEPAAALSTPWVSGSISVQDFARQTLAPMQDAAGQISRSVGQNAEIREMVRGRV